MDNEQVLLERFDNALQEIEVAQTKDRTELAEVESHRALIPAERTARISARSSLQGEIGRIDDEIERAERMGKISEGTEEETAIFERVVAMRQAREQKQLSLDELNQHIADAESKDAAKEEELGKRASTLKARIAKRDLDARHLQEERNTVRRRIDERVYIETIDENEARKNRIAELKAAWEQEEKEYFDWAQDVRRNFRGGYDLKQRLKKQLPQRDVPSELMRLYLAYMDYLIKHRMELPRRLDVPSAINEPEWIRKLTWAPGELFYGDFRAEGEPHWIIRPVEGVRQMLFERQEKLKEPD